MSQLSHSPSAQPEPIAPAQIAPVQITPVQITTRLRLFLLAVLLIGFARLLWELGGKPLWWDESLSLQRAEQPLPGLLLGLLPMTDGVGQLLTRDQHPFAFYLILRLFIAAWGSDEFVLRLPSAFAATLLIPALWTAARLFARWRIYPASTPVWAGLLAAVSPFFLWYGQEARAYILWTLLAVLSSYALLRWREPSLFARRAQPLADRPGWASAYGLLALIFLATHYFSALLLLLHGLILSLSLWPQRPRVAIGLGIAWAVALAGLGVVAAWWVLGQSGAGSNFHPIALPILARDLLNAYSLGLSVDVAQVLLLDLLFGLLAVAGAVAGLRSRMRSRMRGWGGWLIPGLLAVPILILFGGNLIQPLYMNARHLALASAFFLLLVAAGLALLAARSRPAAGLLALLLIGASLYSTANYFRLPTYRKGPDLAQMGTDLRQRLRPGDLLLLNPPMAWRFFHYYLPIAPLDALPPDAQTGWRAVPLIGDDTWDWPATVRSLEEWRSQYRRIWLASEGTHPFIDPDRVVEQWLQASALRVWEQSYFSPNSFLELDLFLTAPPVADALPPALDLRPNAVFGQELALRGVAVEQPLFPDSLTPVTFFWEPLDAIDRRYKYVLWVEKQSPSGPTQPFPRTEQEPYRGFVPTNWWQPGPLVREYSEVAAPTVPSPNATYRLHLFWYDADSLEKLPLTSTAQGEVAPDGATLILPFQPRLPLLPAPPPSDR